MGAQPFDLREYLRVIRTRKWTLILATLLTVGAALASSARQTPQYVAEVRVLAKPSLSQIQATTTTPEVDLETESQLITSEPVATRVIDALDVDESTDSILKGLTITPLRETDVLTISYTDPEPEFARDAANAFGESYIDYRQDEARSALISAQKAVQKRINGTNSRLDDLEESLDKARDQQDADLVETLVTERRTLISQLSSQQQELDSIQPDRVSRLVGGEIIEPADLPSSPASPNHIKNGILGFILGLTFGLALVFVKERLDDRLRDRPDVERTIGAPVLAGIPMFPKRARGKGKGRLSPLVAGDTKGPSLEAYRRLRANVHLVAGRKDVTSLLITSPSAEEGKTVTTANLGVALAQAGYRIAIVSADLRRPMIEQYFEVDSPHGLTNWLEGEESDFHVLLQTTPYENVTLLASGPMTANPAELLSSPRLRELVTGLEESFDFVLFDSPPSLPVADAVILASQVDATLLVIRAQKTRRSAAAHAREELERDKATIVGCVLNEIDISSAPYSYYGYYYQASDRPPVSPDDGMEQPKEAKRSRSLLGFRR
jgi:capsular exopolysaccharide synthesis family protein